MRKLQEEKERNKEVSDDAEPDEDPEEWADLTPAKRQLKENERHFRELQEKKKA